MTILIISKVKQFINTLMVILFAYYFSIEISIVLSTLTEQNNFYIWSSYFHKSFRYVSLIPSTPKG